MGGLKMEWLIYYYMNSVDILDYNILIEYSQNVILRRKES